MKKENSKDLSNFRKLCKSYINYFTSQKNHIYNLLGKKQAYSSGIFRENIIKTFLRELLPKSFSVDSGFIYGR